VSNIISAHKYLPFIYLRAFLRRKYRFPIECRLATHCNHSGNINKSDARMTPKIADMVLTIGRHTYVRQKNDWNQLGFRTWKVSILARSKKAARNSEI
jgi:hypothetical protein